MSQVNYLCGAIILLLTAGTILCAGTNVPSVELKRLNIYPCPGATYICTTSYASGLTWTFQNQPQSQVTVTFTVDSTPSESNPLVRGIFSVRLHSVTDLGSSCANFTSTLTFDVENIQTSVSISCSDQTNTEETGILDAEAVCPGGMQTGDGGTPTSNGGNQTNDNSGIQIAGSTGCLLLTIVIAFITLY